MDEYEVVLDFTDNEEVDDSVRQRLIKAITEKKMIKTKMAYHGDGDYHAIGMPELGIIFNTNTSVGLGQDMGLEMPNKQPTEEEKAEIEKDIKENGIDDGYNKFLEESKNDFLD